MALWLAKEPLVLASRSGVRRTLLEAAGIPVEVLPADLDERAVVTDAAGDRLTAAEAAALLAREKARMVARIKPGRLVLGADQTLACGERQLHKPGNSAAAAGQLRLLRGRTHALHSAIALAQAEAVIFAHVATAQLTMREFSDSFLERYLDATGTAVLDSVGAYQLESLGIHLFERVDGDHFTILGLPLLPLLGFLRRDGWLAG